MMLQIGDDGVVSSVDEENLIYVDKNELEQFIESYQELEEENEQLKSEITGLKELLKSYRKTIKHDAELLADATKKGYLPPLEELEKDME